MGRFVVAEIITVEMRTIRTVKREVVVYNLATLDAGRSCMTRRALNSGVFHSENNLGTLAASAQVHLTLKINRGLFSNERL